VPSARPINSKPKNPFGLRPLGAMIIEIRGARVMLDSDLAELYGVSTGRLNEAVRRNVRRFPEDFMFQVTQEEFAALISQFAISSIRSRGGRRTMPRVTCSTLGRPRSALRQTVQGGLRRNPSTHGTAGRPFTRDWFPSGVAHLRRARFPEGPASGQEARSRQLSEPFRVGLLVVTCVRHMYVSGNR
jgi:hypothetical protein